MRTEQIRALTGIRFFAALWVVLYHSTRANTDYLKDEHREVFWALKPLLGFGTAGVDLFFVLSGFVLALNYLDQLGPRLDLAKAGRFLWLRLARIWPVYMFVTVLAGFLIWFRSHFWHSTHAGRLDAHNFFEQMFMVQLWTAPRSAGTSWAGPAWSLSAEWLAYLLFPLLALVALRLHRLVHARWLMLASLVVLSPLVLVVLQDGSVVGDHTWLLRILTEFTSGVLLCTAMSRLELTDRQRRLAGVVAVLSVLLVVAMLYATRFGAPRSVGLLVVVVFPVLIGALAIGRGPLVSLLSTRALVLGGGLSYSLYLLHGPGLHFFRDATRFTGVFRLERDARYAAELAFIGVLVVMAWAVFRWVEEPSRRLMRRMLDHEFPPATLAIVPAHGRHDPRDERDRATRTTSATRATSATSAPRPWRHPFGSSTPGPEQRANPPLSVWIGRGIRAPIHTDNGGVWVGQSLVSGFRRRAGARRSRGPRRSPRSCGRTGSASPRPTSVPRTRR